jgi:alanine racemase
MELSAPVVAIQKVKAGESIGYGRRFIARKALSVAILGMGYADGLDRHWGDQSSRAVVHFDRVNRGKSRWLGAISMDLSAVIAPSGVRVGDRAQILGAQIDPWVQAEAAGTIPYEILTSLGARVQRIYV